MVVCRVYFVATKIGIRRSTLTVYVHILEIYIHISLIVCAHSNGNK